MGASDDVQHQPYREGPFGREGYDDPGFPRRWGKKIFSLVDGPVTWFRETVVLPNRKGLKYYHQEFPRVPTVDQCYTDDIACIFEAHEQFRRDKKVESTMISILRNRYSDCLFYNTVDEAEKCDSIKKEYEENVDNWFIKYGDLNPYCSVIDAFMKQKHRMIFERRQAEKAGAA
jgi:NADH dehydrogenase (ubiquinone) 1 beta subcomplex subunit 10